MRIRPARAQDAEAVRAITNHWIRNSLITFTSLERTAEDMCAAIDAATGAFLVAEEDGHVAGFASYTPFRKGPGYAHTMEHSVHLDPGQCGRGIGGQLMIQLEKIALDRGVHVLMAAISSANPAGLAFHRRIGFAERGRLPEVGRKAGQWLDLVLMQKILDPANDFNRGRR